MHFDEIENRHTMKFNRKQTMLVLKFQDNQKSNEGK